jgi:uncharacterized protein GlcG (DUF336 family)
MRNGGGIHVSLIPGTFRPVINKNNDYLMDRAAQNPNFLTSIVAASDGRIVPNPGGVLIRDASNHILGAIGISGDTGDNDEIIAVAGIEAAGLKADPGGTKK